MNWGKWIIVSFVLFAAFIATLVTVCMRQDVNLVSRDYYQDELEYQEQIQRLNNANQLHSKPAIEMVGNSLAIDFAHFREIKSGELKLFSPSDPDKDRIYTLIAADVTQQLIPVGDVAKGMYRARFQWVMNGKEYFMETVINI